MVTDVVFSIAKVYNVEKKIDVVLGEKFSIKTDLTDKSSKWFSDNDPVLAIKVVGNNAEIEATGLGSSTILITGNEFGVQKELTINVIEEMNNQAATLGAKPGVPELK